MDASATGVALISASKIMHPSHAPCSSPTPDRDGSSHMDHGSSHTSVAVPTMAWARPHLAPRLIVVMSAVAMVLLMVMLLMVRKDLVAVVDSDFLELGDWRLLSSETGSDRRVQ